jgi:uncharacterized membrane protein
MGTLGRVLGLVESVRLVGEEIRTVTSANAPWMAWNTFLALVPLALAVVLFHKGARRTATWWAGVVAFVLFLPNAPYVLTDVVHLFRVIRYSDANEDVQLLMLHLPLFGAFMAVGFGSYVLSLRLVRNHLRGTGAGTWWIPTLLALNGLTAVGIYLGRVLRLNSWHVVTHPDSVFDSFESLAGRFPLVVIAVTFVVLVVLSTIGALVLDGLVVWYRRQEPRLRSVLGLPEPPQAF